MASTKFMFGKSLLARTFLTISLVTLILAFLAINLNIFSGYFVGPKWPAFLANQYIFELSADGVLTNSLSIFGYVSTGLTGLSLILTGSTLFFYKRAAYTINKFGKILKPFGTLIFVVVLSYITILAVSILKKYGIIEGWQWENLLFEGPRITGNEPIVPDPLPGPEGNEPIVPDPLPGPEGNNPGEVIPPVNPEGGGDLPPADNTTPPGGEVIPPAGDTTPNNPETGGNPNEGNGGETNPVEPQAFSTYLLGIKVPTTGTWNNPSTWGWVYIGITVIMSLGIVSSTILFAIRILFSRNHVEKFAEYADLHNQEQY